MINRLKIKNQKSKYWEIQILSFIFIFAFCVLNYTSVFAASDENTKAPIISIAPPQYYVLDEALYLEGKAPNQSEVELLFERASGAVQPIRVTVKANSNGEWFFSQKLELASGEWYVRARTASDPPSDWSNPRIIQSVVSGFIIGGVKIKYAPVIAVLFLLLIAAAAFFVYSLLRVRAVNRSEFKRALYDKLAVFQRELKEKDRSAVVSFIEQNFSEIRKSVLEELRHFEAKVQNGGVLSKEEEEHQALLLKKLREAEEAIEKKVKEMA